MPGDDATRRRDAALQHGDALWARLQTRLEARVDQPLDDRDWTGRDVYAHLARWQQQSIDALHALLAGEAPPKFDEDEDTLNDRWAEEDRALSAQQARRSCLQARAELRGLAASLEGRQWQQFGSLLDDVTGGHYEHHLGATAP